MLAETLRELSGAALVDEDGEAHTLELLPPATAEELAALLARLPSPLSDEIRDALRVSKGLANGPLETLDLVDSGDFELEEIFPHGHPIGHDGFGNYWIVDLVPDSPAWSPVFFACHDPPVIAYQSDTVETFVRDAVGLWRTGPRSPVDIVHEEVSTRIWASNPGLLSHRDALDSGDHVLEEFAAGLEPEAVLVDLRAARVGDGFSWGRYGPRTAWTRYGTARVWSTLPPAGGSLLSRLFRRVTS